MHTLRPKVSLVADALLPASSPKAVAYAFFIAILICAKGLWAQCSQPIFNLLPNDTLCTVGSVQFDTLNMPGFTSFQWTYCISDLNVTPTPTLHVAAAAHGITNNTQNITAIEDAGVKYMFITGQSNYARLTFGSSYTNTPTASTFATAGYANCFSPMRFVKYLGNWYGFTSNNSNGNLVRYNFGASLSNTPTSTVVTGVNTFTSGAIKLEIVEHPTAGIQVLIANTASPNLTVVTFGTNPTIMNPPTQNVTLPFSIWGFSVVKECDNYSLFAVPFVSSSSGSNQLYRFDFGTSFTAGPPTSTLVATVPGAVATAITVADIAGYKKVFMPSIASTTTCELTFANSFQDVPTQKIINAPQGPYGYTLVKEGSTLIGFGLHRTNRDLFRFDYPAPTCPFSITESTTAEPAGVTVNTIGKFRVHLLATHPSGTVVQRLDTLVVAPPFGVSFTQSCGQPTVELFGNTTPPGLASAWLWDFDDAGATSTLQNPVHSFSSGVGPYTISLTVTDTFGCTQSAAQLTTLKPRPQPAFTYALGCVGQPVAFTNTSTISSGSIVDNQWRFISDGGSASNPPFPTFSHTFPPAADSASVRLVVTSDEGCVDSLTTSFPIRFIAADAVQANCNGSSWLLDGELYYNPADIAQYGWWAGDGTHYPGQYSASHTYTQSGSYTAAFYVQTTNGCTDTLFKPTQATVVNHAIAADTLCIGIPVSIPGYGTFGFLSPRVDFCTPDFSSLPAPATIWTDTASQLTTTGEYFTPLVVGGKRYLFASNRTNIARYDFDATFDNTPAFTFIGNPGSITGNAFSRLQFVNDGTDWWAFRMDYADARLQRYNFGPNIENTTPTASEVVMPGSTGKRPGTPQAVVENGIRRLVVPNRRDSTLHIVSFPGALSATPAIFTQPLPGGLCFGSVTLWQADCGKWVGIGLGGGTMAINDVSTRLYTFDFPDSLTGAPPTVTLMDTFPVQAISMNVFVGKGGYYAIASSTTGSQLYVYQLQQNPNLGGFTRTTYTGITANNGFIMAEDSADVYAFSTPRGNATKPLVRWKYANPCGPQAYQAGANPTYAYTQPGTYRVSYSATVAATGERVERQDTVYVRPGIANSFAHTTACSGRTTVFEFTGTLPQDVSIASAVWNFGDGGQAFVPSPTHTFADTGTYTTTLALLDNKGCTTTAQASIQVNATPQASYTATAACADDDILFQDNSTILPPDTVVYRAWAFANGASVVYNPGLSFTLPSVSLGGSNQFQLVVASPAGCADTLNGTLTVPVLGFTPDGYCANRPIAFTANYAYPTDVPTSFVWSLGPNGSFTGNTPPPVSFAPGTYTLTLAVNTQNGCQDTVTQTLNLVTPPGMNLTVSDTLCVGRTLLLQDLNTFYNSPFQGRQWQVAPQGQAPTVSPNAALTLTPDTALPIQVDYRVTLVGGCYTDTSFTLLPQTPIAVQLVQDTLAVCLGTPVQLAYTQQGPGTVARQRWEIDTLGGVVYNLNPQPTFNFPQPTRQLIRLVAATSQNCVSRDTALVMVLPRPTAGLSVVGPTSGIAPFTLTANNLTQGTAQQYVWQPTPQTTLTLGTAAPLTYTYPDTGTFWLRLTAADGFCTSSDSVLVQVLAPIQPVWDLRVVALNVVTENPFVRVMPTFRNDGNQPITHFAYRISTANGLSFQDTLRGLNLLPGQQVTQQVGPLLQQNPYQPFPFYCVELHLPQGIDDATPWNNDTCTTLAQSLQLLNLYPNPAANGQNLTVSFVAKPDATTNIRVIGTAGHTVMEVSEVPTQPGATQVELPVAGLSAGSYILELRSGDERAHRLFVVH
jgi:PKD repeat protein